MEDDIPSLGKQSQRPAKLAKHGSESRDSVPAMGFLCFRSSLRGLAGHLEAWRARPAAPALSLPWPRHCLVSTCPSSHTEDCLPALRYHPRQLLRVQRYSLLSLLFGDAIRAAL